jgi:hypothetical protein
MAAEDMVILDTVVVGEAVGTAVVTVGGKRPL